MKIVVIALLNFFSSNVFARECRDFDQLIKDTSLNPTKDDIARFQKEGQQLLNQSFETRLKLHQELPKLGPECRVRLKDVFLRMREREDFIAAHFYSTPQITAESVEYKKVPLPIYNPEAYAPMHLSHPKEKFEFKSGDILITKGISFISSTISEVVTPRALFSHMVFIHVDDVTKKVSTMESYIGYGVKIFTIEEALRNENARIMVLRSKDQVVAKTAADYMFNKIQKLQREDKSIAYDYDLNFDDNTKLSCEEIAYDAFKQMSHGKFIIPEKRSKVVLKDAAFLKKIGVRPGELMMPVDLETDSRFELVLDWADYKIIRDSIRKDAVIGEMFKHMNEEGYKVQNNFRSIGARIVWATRSIPGLWHLMSKLSGIPSDFKKDVPAVAISTLESVKSIGGTILEFAQDADEEFHRQNDRWLTPEELRRTIANYLKNNPDAVSNFHK